MLDIKTVRAAVIASRGGWETADDAAMRQLWESLSDETRQQYLDKIQKKEKGGK